ncbi:MAG: indole-3-glycerol-phosphate synthase TrpC, partial [Gemmatimonadales bacterium]
MSDFLERMGALSHERLRLARATLSETQLLQRITGETRTRAIDDDVFEIMFSTPSAGALASGDTNDVAGRTMDYEHGGAFMISVLTEPSEFGGSLNYLATAHRATSLPILCKDFLIDPYQVLQARAAGADGVLL